MLVTTGALYRNVYIGEEAVAAGVIETRDVEDAGVAKPTASKGTRCYGPSACRCSRLGRSKSGWAASPRRCSSA